ncbi:hypothetical protein [Spongiactinospora sp. 9N601]|uniref:hypothetical protein n=1 Tax=Spongiactinospora sp. 9N601 TaxID=3375149 RepID=UPI0037AA1E99
MLDIDALLESPVTLPFGLGDAPIWSLLISAIILGVLFVLLIWGAGGEKVSSHSKASLDQQSARGSALSGKSGVAAVILTAVIFLTGIWQWQEQRSDDELGRHAEFVGRVTVLGYLGSKVRWVVIRNANSAAIDVIVWVDTKKYGIQYVRVLVPPCSEAKFQVWPYKGWAAFVAKGGMYWMPGTDPIPLSGAQLQAYGATLEGDRYEFSGKRFDTPAIREIAVCNA